MAEPTIPQLRVKALQPKRHRAGLEFTSAPSDLTVEMLGTGFAAITALAAILADPLLSVTVVEGETERPITDEERDALTAFIEAESARAQPDDPPTADAAEAAEADRLPAEQAEKDHLAAEQTEADRLAAEQAEKNRLAAEQTEADRLAAKAVNTSSKPSGRKAKA